MKFISVFLILFFSLSVQANKMIETEASVSPLSEIEKAYQREYAFLQAQKRSLKKQMSQIDNLYKGQIKQAQGEVDQLRGATVRAGISSQKLATDLNMLGSSVESLDESEAQLKQVAAQSLQSLRGQGLVLSETEQKDTEALPVLGQIAKNFERASTVLTGSNKFSSKEGDFFLNDGTLTKGTVVSMGQVAKFAKWNKGSGILTPSGDGKFKITKSLSADVSKSLFSSNPKMPTLLKTYLYENSNQAVQAKKSKSVLDVINSGGSVAWVIVGLGLVALALIVMRWLMLGRLSKVDMTVVSKVHKALEKNDLAEAQSLVRSGQGSSVHAMLSKMVDNFAKSKESIEDIFAEHYEKEKVKLDRFSTVILILASIAPLMGLLGTVTGMISTFDIITEYGTGDPKLLSGGISEALVTTELGLVVAIPTLFVGTLLSGWAKKVKSKMETLPLEIFNKHHASLRKPGGKA